MAVPAHDERDFAFATAYNLDIVKVVAGEEGVIEGWYAGEGTAINSPPVVEVDGGDNPYAITGWQQPRPKPRSSLRSSPRAEVKPR